MNTDIAIPTRAHVERLESYLQMLPQTVMPLEHYFAGGMYARVLHIPAGTVLTGAVHRTEHINILAAGEITVTTDEGVKFLRAPAVVVAKPGSKRAGLAHSDTTWITVCRTEHTDPESAAAELVEPAALLESKP